MRVEEEGVEWGGGGVRGEKRARARVRAARSAPIPRPLSLTWIANEHDVVVLPTPPLPPTKTQRRLESSTFWRVGSGRVSAIVSVPIAFCVLLLKWRVGARALSLSRVVCEVWEAGSVCVKRALEKVRVRGGRRPATTPIVFAALNSSPPRCPNALQSGKDQKKNCTLAVRIPNKAASHTHRSLLPARCEGVAGLLRGKSMGGGWDCRRVGGRDDGAGARSRACGDAAVRASSPRGGHGAMPSPLHRRRPMSWEARPSDGAGAGIGGRRHPALPAARLQRSPAAAARRKPKSARASPLGGGGSAIRRAAG
jgi:hypothetical protein